METKQARVEKEMRRLLLVMEKKEPLVRAVPVTFDESLHDSPRHFAGTFMDAKFPHIFLAPSLGSLPRDQIGAVLAHEYGHAIDGMVPKKWSALSDAELRADAIGEALTERRIRYAPPLYIQTFGSGVSRPRNLK